IARLPSHLLEPHVERGGAHLEADADDDHGHGQHGQDRCLCLCHGLGDHCQVCCLWRWIPWLMRCYSS
ncbi:hypothetical protein, partial [Klebsiella aerogenes]|uniref:hypothetical protein n=1 Tax=Klebsiella aerogenes TaxID=548 RepID=UPI001953FBBD